MKTIIGVLGGLGLLISFAPGATADSHTSADRAKIFVLREDSKASLVLPAKDAHRQTATFMRMPDLGLTNSLSNSATHSSTNANPKASKKAVATGPMLGSYKRPMQFSSAKISGVMHLPRVKFARVGVAMENRDEFPSLDFTQKSLKENGY
jgi:hypothetical protein